MAAIFVRRNHASKIAAMGRSYQEYFAIEIAPTY